MTTVVSVIIPVWNLWEMTQNCLRSLAEHTDMDTVEVVVVDNGSTDATASELATLGAALFGEHFQAVRLPENKGFACACNAGAKVAHGNYLFFLNNDTLVTAGWLPPLLRAVQPAHVGMVGAKLLYPGNDRVQHVGITFSPAMEATHMYRLFPAGNALVSKPRTVQAVTGAALLLEAGLFAACGGFFEGYRNGFEDMDLCCMVQRQGRRVVLEPQSVIYHLTSQTPGRFDHDGSNAKVLFERTAGFFTPDMHKIAAEDGLTPYLSPALHFYVGLAEAQEQALTQAFATRFDEGRCRQRLEAFPLWQGGYSLLAHHLGQAGRWDEACDWLTLQTQFFPLPECAAELARSALRAGDTTLAGQALAAAQSVHPDSVGLDALRRKATALAQWGREVGDAQVTALYTQWLNRQK